MWVPMMSLCTARRDGEVRRGGCNVDPQERKKSLENEEQGPKVRREGGNDHKVHDETRCQMERGYMADMVGEKVKR